MAQQWKYMPILKQKRGERDALRYMKDAHRDSLVPIIELQAKDGEDEVRFLTRLIDDVETARLPGESFAIDPVHYVISQERTLNTLASVCTRLSRRIKDRECIPVLNGACIQLVNKAPKSRPVQQLVNFPSVIVRLRTDLFTAAQVSSAIAIATSAGFRKASIHLVIDQFSMVDTDPTDAAKKVFPYLRAAIAQKCASVTLAGGSFPVDLTGQKQGVTDLPRVEWLVWANLPWQEFPDLRYGDYAVTNPSRLAQIDPTQVNPSISIRYAANTFWRLYKGGGFKRGTPHTLASLCKLLTGDSIYAGEKFSYGDGKYYSYATKNRAENGTPWTWRRDATNHHMALTVEAL